MKKSLKGIKPSGEMVHKMAQKSVKMTGKFHGKSNKLGQGGRAAQLKAQGVPGGVIGALARRAQAAPGQKNFHKKKISVNTEMAMKKKGSKKTVSMGGNKKMKSSKKGVTGMKGDVKRKSFGSMENGGNPVTAVKSTPRVTPKAPNKPFTGKVNMSAPTPWTNTATGKALKKSKAKKK